jgi:hypothetical protein
MQPRSVKHFTGTAGSSGAGLRVHALLFTWAPQCAGSSGARLCGGRHAGGAFAKQRQQPCRRVAAGEPPCVAAGEPPAAMRRPGRCRCLAAAPRACCLPQSRAPEEPAHWGDHVNNSACTCRPCAGPAATPPAPGAHFHWVREPQRENNMRPTLARGWACTPSTQATRASQARAIREVAAARAPSRGA